MNPEGKPPEPSHDTLDDAFFSRDPQVEHLGLRDASGALCPKPHAPSEQTDGAPSVASAADELGHLPDLAPDYDEDAVLGRRRGPGAVALALVIVGALLGGSAGYFLLQKAPKDAPTSSASTSASATKIVAAPSISSPASATVASASPSALPAKAPAGGARTARPAGPGDLAGFSGPNVGGPSAKATGELGAGEISGVVERNRPLIRRRCWQPELEIRKAMGAAGSARVNASFTIGPSGSVQSASASGAESDYPGLSSCIAARIREWKFPPSSGPTPVNVPFVFAAR